MECTQLPDIIHIKIIKYLFGGYVYYRNDIVGLALVCRKYFKWVSQDAYFDVTTSFKNLYRDLRVFMECKYYIKHISHLNLRNNYTAEDEGILKRPELLQTFKSIRKMSFVINNFNNRENTVEMLDCILKNSTAITNVDLEILQLNQSSIEILKEFITLITNHNQNNISNDKPKVLLYIEEDGDLDEECKGELYQLLGNINYLYRQNLYLRSTSSFQTFIRETKKPAYQYVTKMYDLDWYGNDSRCEDLLKHLLKWFPSLSNITIKQSEPLSTSSSQHLANYLESNRNIWKLDLGNIPKEIITQVSKLPNIKHFSFELSQSGGQYTFTGLHCLFVFISGTYDQNQQEEFITPQSTISNIEIRNGIYLKLDKFIIQNQSIKTLRIHLYDGLIDSIVKNKSLIKLVLELRRGSNLKTKTQLNNILEKLLNCQTLNSVSITGFPDKEYIVGEIVGDFKCIKIGYFIDWMRI